MKFGMLNRAGFVRQIYKLAGTGYATDEDSVRYQESDAIATIAAMVAESLQGAVGSLSSQSVEAALDLVEELLFFVQGQSLSLVERQGRLMALAMALPKMTPARVANAFARYLNASNGSTVAPTLPELIAHRASPLGAFLVQRREPGAATTAQRRDLATIFARGLSAISIPGGVSTADATWSSSIEPASIKTTVATGVGAQTKARVATVDVYPGSVVTRAMWREIQAQLCWKSHGFSLNQASQGRTIFVSGNAGSYTDASIDWSNRFVQAWGAASAAAATDPTTLSDASHGWLPPSKMGPAGSGYTHAMRDTSPSAATNGVTFAVNGSGALVITNGSGRNLRMFVRGSPKYTAGSTADTQPWVDTTGVTHDQMADIYASTVVSAVGAAGQFASVPAGAMRRVVYSGPLSREGDIADGVQAVTKVPRSVILDSSEDWRNRYVLVMPLTQSNTPAPLPPDNYPLPSNVGMYSPAFLPASSSPRHAPRVFYTGDGVEMGADTALPYQHACRDVFDYNTSIWLFVDPAGNLCCEMKAEASYRSAGVLLAMIVASERTNGTSVVTAVPVHATQPQSIDFEQPQNNGCFAQGRQGGVPRYLLSEPEPRVRPTCPPLGLISEGNSPVRPAKWEIRERLGGQVDTTWERRQPIERQRKRVVSIAVPAGAKVAIDTFNAPSYLDSVDQFDARDRAIWIEGRFSTTNITVSNASQQSDASATPFNFLLYAGPGSDTPFFGFNALATGLTMNFVFSRNFEEGGYHSPIVIENLTGAPVYFNFTVEVTGHLGFSDRRGYGPRLLTPPTP